MARMVVVLIAALVAVSATEALGEEFPAAAGDACPHIDMGPMRDWAPECLMVCPQMCTPLEHVHKAFESSEQLRGVEAELCEHRKDFVCFYEHEGACKSMAVEAEKLGVKLPETRDALEKRCQ